MIKIQKASAYAGMDRLKALVHGNSGAGKTHLGATAKRPIIALCEPQAMRTIRRVNPEADVVLIETMDDLRELISEIRKRLAADNCPWDTVVLDSLTEMQRIIKNEQLTKGGTAKDSPSQGDWGIIIDRTTNIARAFRDLPMHVLIFTLSAEEFIEESRWVRPSVQGRKLPNDLAGFFNVVGYIYRVYDQEADVVSHRVRFAGGDGMLIKSDPDLQKVEYPHWPSWIRRCYGEDALGAANDKEFVQPKRKQAENGSQGKQAAPKTRKTAANKKTEASTNSDAKAANKK